jgi:hypothetical protein
LELVFAQDALIGQLGELPDFLYRIERRRRTWGCASLGDVALNVFWDRIELSLMIAGED